MNESLKIECEWWGSSNGEMDFSQVCRGAIGMSVGEEWLTRLEDSWGNTVRNRLNASAYTLAAWFARNWWRLRWEPETPSSRTDVDWRMSHSMASAGDGYCWPSILFASDGGDDCHRLGFRGSMPKLAVNQKFEQGEKPWQRATKLSRLARRDWGLGSGPITNSRLADLLGASPSIFEVGARGTAPMPLVLRDADTDKADIYLNRAHPTSRRFAASRLIGDSLLESIGGRLLPATTAKTARQQFQRAFAQEFLCPFDALKDRVLATGPDEDDIAEAAAYFDVSTRVIETTLVNKGELDRESLAWGV